eukprot:1068255-Karenia_brevis.AAC.1
MPVLYQRVFAAQCQEADALEASAPCPAEGEARSRGPLPCHLVPSATPACRLLRGDRAYSY